MKSPPTMHSGPLGAIVRVPGAGTGKLERGAEVGVRELWWLHGRGGSEELRIAAGAVAAK